MSGSGTKLISSLNNLKYLKSSLVEFEIIDLNSDLKHRIFPRPFERLSNLRGKTNLVGVEIGVCGAEHARSLLATFDISTLYLVDPYEMYETYTEGEEKNYRDTQLPLSEIFLEAKKLLEPFNPDIIVVDIDEKESKKTVKPIKISLENGTGKKVNYVLDSVVLRDNAGPYPPPPLMWGACSMQTFTKSTF